MDNENRFEVFSVSERDDKTYWSRVGAAFVNRDGSINVTLEALPVNGRLQLRHPPERERDEAPRRREETRRERR